MHLDFTKSGQRPSKIGRKISGQRTYPQMEETKKKKMGKFDQIGYKSMMVRERETGNLSKPRETKEGRGVFLGVRCLVNHAKKMVLGDQTKKGRRGGDHPKTSAGERQPRKNKEEFIPKKEQYFVSGSRFFRSTE